MDAHGLRLGLLRGPRTLLGEADEGIAAVGIPGLALAGAAGFVEAGLGERLECVEDLGDLVGGAGERAVGREPLRPGADVPLDVCAQERVSAARLARSVLIVPASRSARTATSVRRAASAPE